MFKILLPVDFSEASDKACMYALNLAAATPGAQLLLLHCFQDYLLEPEFQDPALAPLTSSEVITERVLHRNEKEEQLKLEALYHTLLEKAENNGYQVAMEHAFRPGLPEQIIAEEADRYKPNLVLMGTKGETGLARSFFGTVTTQLVQELKVPVLTVPETYNGQGLSHVAYATDFSSSDIKAIRKLQQLLGPLQPHIQCIHISDEGEQQQDLEKLMELQANLQRNHTGEKIEFTLLEGEDVAERLQRFADQNRIQLLALTTLKRTMLGSILHQSLARKLALEAQVPLLVFHEQDSI